MSARVVWSTEPWKRRGKLAGFEAIVWPLPRTGNGKDWAAEVEGEGFVTEHRTEDLAIKAAERRLRQRVAAAG